MSMEVRAGRRIGRWGTGARVLVGTTMIAIAAAFGIEVWDALLGLVAFPLAVTAAVLIRGRSAPPLRLTGPGSHGLNCVIIVAVLIAVPDAALLLYGVSMLLAAVRGDGGCELFSASNALMRRDDEIGCPFLWPIDRIEAQHRLH
jgi:hypothetical protein